MGRDYLDYATNTTPSRYQVIVAVLKVKVKRSDPIVDLLVDDQSKLTWRMDKLVVTPTVLLTPQSIY